MYRHQIPLVDSRLKRVPAVPPSQAFQARPTTGADKNKKAKKKVMTGVGLAKSCLAGYVRKSNDSNVLSDDHQPGFPGQGKQYGGLGNLHATYSIELAIHGGLEDHFMKHIPIAFTTLWEPNTGEYADSKDTTEIRYVGRLAAFPRSVFYEFKP
ncbi:hypothetical protein SAMD00023353_2401090 [Rosellinia necatrix]|uniref:Uncharacterized protein n=1 Tax=Rosellinia necatrix TaxID=77044 RepID=A0A1S8A832_ROSNE|nr:hypothetical protein SAMD00023353_2401090 [Rosellinia necatrix]